MGVTLQRSSDCNLCPGSQVGCGRGRHSEAKLEAGFWFFLDYIIIFLLKYNCFAMFC